MEPVEIVALGPRGEVTRRLLADDVVIIGRDPQCHVRLDDRSVSRRHAAVWFDGAGLVAQDLSTNGTFMRGRRLQGEERLVPGDVLEIASYRLQLAPLSPAPDDATLAPIASEPKVDEPIADEPNDEHAAAADPLAAFDERKRWLRDLLLDSLDLRQVSRAELEGEALRQRVVSMLEALIDDHARDIPPTIDRAQLRRELTDEVLGLGPLEWMLKDAGVSEIMVINRSTIYIERQGRIELTPSRFSSDDALRSAIERIVTPLGRRIDESTPMVDARLPDGSRVNAIIPPLALKGSCLTVRKFPARRLGVDDLITGGSLDERMARFLRRAVIARRNIVVSGGTGSGKTTLLNVLSSAIPSEERIVTIEDSAELSLHQPHVVSLETRPKNMEGRGEYTIRDLVKNALRMRPDRIVVGECRGGEALDMLQAMNTGHDGSLTTLHANSADEAIARLETLVLMAGLDLPSRAIREQIASSVHVIVQQARFADGSRRIVQISEVVGIQDDGSIRCEPIFEFDRAANAGDGRVRGRFRATGYMPSFIEEFVTLGLVRDGVFL